MNATSLDTETFTFRPGCMAPPLVCLTEPGYLYTHDVARGPAERLLSGNDPVAIGNAAYDAAVLCAEFPDMIPLVFDAYSRGILKDILIRQKLIDLALGKFNAFGPYSVAGLTKRLARVDLKKEDSPRLDYERLRGVPLEQWPAEHVRYAKDDAYWHLECYRLQQEGLHEENALDVLDDEDRQARGAFALHLASVWGIRTDAVAIERLRSLSVKHRDDLRPALLDAGLIVQTRKGFVKKSAPLQERVFVAMGGFGREEVTTKGVRVVKRIRTFVPMGGWDRVKLTKTGKAARKAGNEWRQLKYVATDAEACRDSGDDLLVSYVEYSHLDSLLTGHIPAVFEGVTRPIHTRFDSLKQTGRTGSRDPNIQNVRRAEGARECFVPRAGHVFIGCDYDKAELHTLAQCCIDLFGRSALADALNAGFDPHTGLGARLAGTTYEGLLERLAAKDKTAKEWRQRAKPGNFGFPGGMGAFGMRAYAKTQYGVIMTMPESEQLYAGWQEQWPEVAYDYLGWIREQCDDDGLANIKHFQSNRYRSRIPYTVAANSFFQGRAADGAKAALFEVARLCYSVPGSALFGCRIVNFIHDEILLEVPRDARLTERARELQAVMVREFTRFVPDVPVRATPCAMDRWSKSAETILRDGELLVWEYAAPTLDAPQ